MGISPAARLRWLSARLLLLALTFIAVFTLVYLVTVHTLEGRLLGDASLRGALLTHSRLAATTERVLDVVSVASLLATVAVVAVIALLRLARLPGLVAIGILVASNVSTLLLKNYVLSRPDLGADEIAPATLNSLPSGHATAAFSAVVALIFVIPGRWRLTTAVLGATYATVTGLATMSAGWHRAGDSIAAFLLVGAWSMLGATVLLAADATRTPSRGESPVRRWLEAAAVGCVIAGVTLGLALTAIPPLRDSTPGFATAFIAGGLLITGASTAVLIAVLGALDLSDQPTTPA